MLCKKRRNLALPKGVIKLQIGMLCSDVINCKTYLQQKKFRVP
jgi:hypothetical protein